MLRRGLSLAVFERSQPTDENLPDYIEDCEGIPCHETLNFVLAPTDSEEGWDHRKVGLREMVIRDLQQGRGMEEVEQRISDLEEMVERLTRREMPMGTKKSGKSYSRRDRAVKTRTQNLIQLAGVETFQILWKVLIEKDRPKKEGEKRGKREQKEKKKQKQRIFDTVPLMRMREEFERRAEKHVVSTEERVSDFIVDYEKRMRVFAKRARTEKNLAMENIMGARRSEEETKLAIAEIEEKDYSRKDQLMLDTEFAQYFVDFLFPREDQLLLLNMWKEISPIESVIKSQVDDEFAVSMMMRFECTKEICSTPEWSEHCDSVSVQNLDADRKQELLESAEFIGSTILEAWSKKQDTSAPSRVFLRSAIDLCLVSRCLQRLNKEKDEQTFSGIEINFEEDR